LGAERGEKRENIIAEGRFSHGKKWSVRRNSWCPEEGGKENRRVKPRKLTGEMDVQRKITTEQGGRSEKRSSKKKKNTWGIIQKRERTQRGQLDKN